MKLKHKSLVASLMLTLSILGCSDREEGSGTGDAVSSSGTNGEVATDHWLGQWNGPEGTFLLLSGGQGKYEITIQNLDGPRTFQGSAVSGQIHFERNGLKESIRASDGAATGMKWLSNKSNCLTVRPGEGYCRD
ncbi:hypothetical protein [Rhodoferax ferrireducens]|uniref:hypothetical protein n=1 Tax=Rhodoferax ferrireducens TaxID=192843 RepID=UPI000E0D87BA|nr:hypothetical protein [Rhodoferax ferrireducens]